MKEIIYGIDSGGSILRELIEVRKETLNKILPSLKARLDTFETDTTAQFQQKDLQLSQKANQLFVDTMQTYLENKIAMLVDGSPKGVEPTFEALKAKYPTKTSGVYVVTADKQWYFWLDGFGWTAGGVYQTVQIEMGDNEHQTYS